MAALLLRDSVGEEMPLLTTLCALAIRNTSISCVPVAAEVLGVTSKAEVLVLLALKVLKLL